MATPIINNLVLPVECLLVLPDEAGATTGIINRTSGMGGGIFMSSDLQTQDDPTLHTHVLFVKKMATEVNIDGIEYQAMHEHAIVGLIPD